MGNKESKTSQNNDTGINTNRHEQSNTNNTNNTNNSKSETTSVIDVFAVKKSHPYIDNLSKLSKYSNSLKITKRKRINSLLDSIFPSNQNEFPCEEEVSKHSIVSQSNKLLNFLNKTNNLIANLLLNIDVYSPDPDSLSNKNFKNVKKTNKNCTYNLDSSNNNNNSYSNSSFPNKLVAQSNLSFLNTINYFTNFDTDLSSPSSNIINMYTELNDPRIFSKNHEKTKLDFFTQQDLIIKAQNIFKLENLSDTTTESEENIDISSKQNSLSIKNQKSLKINLSSIKLNNEHNSKDSKGLSNRNNTKKTSDMVAKLSPSPSKRKTHENYKTHETYETFETQTKLTIKNSNLPNNTSNASNTSNTNAQAKSTSTNNTSNEFNQVKKIKLENKKLPNSSSKGSLGSNKNTIELKDKITKSKLSPEKVSSVLKIDLREPKHKNTDIPNTNLSRNEESISSSQFQDQSYSKPNSISTINKDGTEFSYYLTQNTLNTLNNNLYPLTNQSGYATLAKKKSESLSNQENSSRSIKNPKSNTNNTNINTNLNSTKSSNSKFKFVPRSPDKIAKSNETLKEESFKEKIKSLKSLNEGVIQDDNTRLMNKDLENYEAYKNKMSLRKNLFDNFNHNDNIDHIDNEISEIQYERPATPQEKILFTIDMNDWEAHSSNKKKDQSQDKSKISINDENNPNKVINQENLSHLHHKNNNKNNIATVDSIKTNMANHPCQSSNINNITNINNAPSSTTGKNDLMDKLNKLKNLKNNNKALNADNYQKNQSKDKSDIKTKNKTKEQMPMKEFYSENFHFETMPEFDIHENNINSSNDRFSFQRRQTPEFDKSRNSRKSATTIEEEERFSFNNTNNSNVEIKFKNFRTNVKDSTSNKIRYDFEINEEIDDNDLKDVDGLDD